MTVPVPSDPIQDLLQAFLHTDYVVSTPTLERTVRIGRLHPELDRVIEGRDWAILTACNPRATCLDDTRNRRLQRQLIETVAGSGLEFLDTRNRDPAGHWPEEPGLMILDADHQWVVRLATQFSQLGFVAGHAGQPARLYLSGGDWPAQLPPWVTRVD